MNNNDVFVAHSRNVSLRGKSKEDSGRIIGNGLKENVPRGEYDQG